MLQKKLKGYTVKLYNDKNTEPEIIVDSELTTLQKQLIEIWKNTLGIEKVDIDDDFFKLGGTSMLLIKLAFEISDKLNIDIQMLCCSILCENLQTISIPATIQMNSAKNYK